MNIINKKDLFHNFEVGYKFSRTFKITIEDHEKFKNLTNDDSPLHTDVNFAKLKGYNNIIGYSFLLTSLLSYCFGKVFPAGNDLCLKNETSFLKFYYIPNQLEYNFELININEELSLIELKYTVKSLLQKENIMKGKNLFKII